MSESASATSTELSYMQAVAELAGRDQAHQADIEAAEQQGARDLQAAKAQVAAVEARVSRAKEQMSAALSMSRRALADLEVSETRPVVVAGPDPGNADAALAELERLARESHELATQQTAALTQVGKLRAEIRRILAEREAAQRRAAEQAERERLAAERAAREERERLERERLERQRAQEAREAAEREAQAQAEAARRARLARIRNFLLVLLVVLVAVIAVLLVA